MPIVCDVPLTMDMEQVLRRQGIRDQIKIQPQIVAVLHELLAAIDYLHLLEPAIAYELYPISEARHAQLCLGGGAVLRGGLLPSLLASALELAIAICTIGPRLEEKVADYFAQNELLRAILLSGIGSAAVDALAQEACQLIQREGATRGYDASSPLSPGMPGFPLSQQRQLFRLAPAEQIGVCLNSSAMMVPGKSMSMVIGLGLGMPIWTQAEVCEHCSLKDTCHYKVHAWLEA